MENPFAKNRCAPGFPAAPLYFPLCEPLPVVLQLMFSVSFPRNYGSAMRSANMSRRGFDVPGRKQVSCGSLNFHQQTKPLKLAHFQLPKQI